MAGFQRRFDSAGLDLFVDQGSPRDRRWTDLLEQWRPSGAPSESLGLRLVVHDEALAFYRRGQCVAKVEYIAGALNWKVHRKYVSHPLTTTRNYVTIAAPCADSIARYAGPQFLHAIIAQADKRAKREKSFVDNLVHANRSIIDLEMGWAVSADAPLQLIDLVDLELRDGFAAIVAWEAKTSENPEMTHPSLRRARADKKPHKYVADQVKQYHARLSQSENRLAVVAAYRESCRILEKLHRATGGAYQLSDAIIRVATDDAFPLEIDPMPRVVVLKASRINESRWQRKLDALRAEGIHVHVCERTRPDTFILSRP